MPSLPKPPVHAEKELSTVTAAMVDELIKAIVASVDPLNEEFPALVSRLARR